MVTTDAPIKLDGDEESEANNVVAAPKRKVHRWTAEENQKLENLVRKAWPNVRWPQIAQELPGRTGKQCRERWMNARPGNKKGAWSNEEEKTIAKMHSEMGPAWSKIAKALPGRTENDTKNHWNALLRCKTLEARQDSMLGHYVLLVRNGADPNPSTFQRALMQYEEVQQRTADMADQDGDMAHESVQGNSAGTDEAMPGVQDEASSAQRLQELTQELTNQLDSLSKQEITNQLDSLSKQAALPPVNQEMQAPSKDASMIATSRAAPAVDALMATSSPCSGNMAAGPQEAFTSNPMQSLEMACRASRQAAMERAMLGGGLNTRLAPGLSGTAGGAAVLVVEHQGQHLGIRAPSPSFGALLSAPGHIGEGEGMSGGNMMWQGHSSGRRTHIAMEAGGAVDVPPADLGHMMQLVDMPHTAPGDLPLSMTPLRTRLQHSGMPGAPLRPGGAWETPGLTSSASSRRASKPAGLQDEATDPPSVHAVSASRSHSGLMGRQAQMFVRPSLKQLGLDGSAGMRYGVDSMLTASGADSGLDDPLRPTPRMLSWSTRRDPLLAMRLAEMRQSLRDAYVHDEDPGEGWGGEVPDDAYPEAPQQRSASFPRGQPPSSMDMPGMASLRHRDVSASLRPAMQPLQESFLEKCLREGMVMSSDSYGVDLVADNRMEVTEADGSYPASMFHSRRHHIAADMSTGYGAPDIMMDARQAGVISAAHEVQRVSAVKRASCQELAQEYVGPGAASGLKRQNSSLRGSTAGGVAGSESPRSNTGLLPSPYHQAFASTSASQGPPTDTDARSLMTPSDPPSDSIPSDLRARSGLMSNPPADLLDELLGNPNRLAQENNAMMKSVLDRPLSAETPGWQSPKGAMDGSVALSYGMRSLQVQLPSGLSTTHDLGSPTSEFGVAGSVLTAPRHQSLSFTQGLTNRWAGMRGLIDRPAALLEDQASVLEERLAMAEAGDEGLFVLGTSGGSFTAGYTSRQMGYSMLRSRGRSTTPRSLINKRGLDNISRLARSTTMYQDAGLASPYGASDMHIVLQQQQQQQQRGVEGTALLGSMRPLSSPADLPNFLPVSPPSMNMDAQGFGGSGMQAAGDAGDLVNPMRALLHIEGTRIAAQQQAQQQQSSDNSMVVEQVQNNNANR